MSAQQIIDDRGLDILLRQARTHKDWKPAEVSDVLIQSLYDLMKWGPTSMNCTPARILFVKSQEAKERLKPYLDAGNVDKTMNAPVTAIIAHDLRFYEKMGKLAPHMKNPGASFEGKDQLIKATAFRNGTLQGGYLILAARALGLDCGPMSGFNNQGVKDEFFPEEDIEVNFLCNLGYGNPEKLHPRAPRLSFDEACKIL